MQKNPSELVKAQLSAVKHKIVILSGKGGVGKSTVALNLALTLNQKFHGRVGIVDVDIHGPNIPKMLGVEDERIQQGENDKFLPVIDPVSGLKVISMAYFLESKTTPVIWRGPLKMKAIQQFLVDFVWGDLEYLIFDLPPGTGDEALSVMQLIPESKVIVVTTPQEVSLLDTGKAVTMSQKMGKDVLGIIENMSEFICPNCGTSHKLFGSGGGEKLSKETGTTLLGSIPFDPEIMSEEDKGIKKPFASFQPISEKIIKKLNV